MQEERNSIQATPSCNWSEEQRIAVREEIKRILAHPTFRNSARCSELLGHVVNRVLAGEESEIKERTLGIEVFERDANYDIGSDPVVRRFANEIRKRIAQYYQDDPDGHIVKIHMPRGSYIPECEFLPADNPVFSTAQGSSSEPAPASLLHPKRSSALSGKLRPSQWALAIAVLVLLIAAGLMLWNMSILRSPINRVWKPLLDSKGEVIVCLPDRRHPTNHMQPGSEQKTPGDMAGAAALPGAPPPPPAGEPLEPVGQPPSILIGDLAVGDSVTALLRMHGKNYKTRSSSVLKYPELQQNPVVLIGGVNNHWTRALLSNLRYSIQLNMATRDSWIQDAQAPSKRDWLININPDHSPPPVDYALITRVFNEETGQWILALSGLEGYATQAAGKFVTDPKFAKKIPANLRGTGNFQIVLRTSMMSEEPGPMQVVAFYTW